MIRSGNYPYDPLRAAITELQNARAELQALPDQHDAVLPLRLYLLDDALDWLRLINEEDYEIWRHFHGA